MNAPKNLNPLFRAPKLPWTRMVIALAVAVTADGLQFLLGPLGWVVVDQVIDVVAFTLTAWAIGFHLLLLPTFAVEFIPGVNMLPTWTACVIAVIALRKREQNPPSSGLPTKSANPKDAQPANVIDLPP